jgi:hypothetical protein
VERQLPFFLGKGIGDDAHWAAEESFLVLGIDAPDAQMLGRDFEQAAILAGGIDAIPRLFWCDP